MIGIDIGGANLKVVDEDGVHIHYCPLWEKAPITDLLLPYAQESDGSAVVVMSGELADCFSNKLQGIAFIVDAVQKAFPKARFYGMDARFHTGAVPELAAANWLASADYLRDLYPHAVLLDVGSTTADIVPLNRFDDLHGLTDTRRLQKGYLLYTGMLRTSIPTLMQWVDLQGIRTPVSTEYFAASADAHLVLGHVTPEQYSCDTPDRKEKTVPASLRRLARVVCADLEEIGEAGAREIAAQFWEIQRTMIGNQVRKVSRECGAADIVVAGIGAPLFARELDGVDLTRKLGPVADALPALAVGVVAKRENIFP
jgi:(4-(4-[2-(gamma-L-glutamylamino)ethyl]phenoxymethyl)furan-2-yl)methanamine synthase